MAKLTQKEIILLHAIDAGVSRPGCGWLDQIAERLERMDYGWARDREAVISVLESLVKRGAVKAHKIDEPGFPINYWVGEPAS